MSDEWKSFVSIGQAFAAHDTVRHSDRQYVGGSVHANSAEGFNDRIRRTVAGVFHHISPHHADLCFNEIGFRWSQRVISGQAVRRRRSPPDAQGPGSCQAAVVSDRARPPTGSRVPIGRRTPTTSDRARWYPDPMPRRCVWLIKAALFI